MTQLESRADLRLSHAPAYFDRIRDRLESFDSVSSRNGDAVSFRFAFGEASFEMPEGAMILTARSPHVEGLARLKDLMATAVEFYAREEKPQLVWQGDLAGAGSLAQFRLMRVEGVRQLTPHMRRVQLAGPDLGRFATFGGMHIRMLFPTESIPQPVWPVRGPNGLVEWPDETKRPPARVYTIRALDVAAGTMDVDMLIHDGENVGSNWASKADVDDVVGIIGPVGRPVRAADWYVLGADETGLPAIARMLETFPAATRGTAFIEVVDAGEEQSIDNKTQIEIRWLHRHHAAAGEGTALADAVLTVEWPSEGRCFGWFGAESESARLVREHWRVARGLGRDQTLAAAYWTRGAAGTMAG